MIDRYSRQTIFPGISKQGQQKLADSFVVVAGCGALGTVSASALVRAGVGRVKIIDRDFIEIHNLQRQLLFNEEDVENQIPKAVAAQRHLSKINSDVKIEGVVSDINYSTVESLVEGADLIIDGSDNFETRLLINDVSLKHKIPWIYGGAVASGGMTMNIIPGTTPCFRCRLPKLPEQGVALTCDTAGVIGPATMTIGALQSAEALKILTESAKLNLGVIMVDVWEDTFLKFKSKHRADCPTCNGTYDFLEARHGTVTTVLCGQNSVQILNPKRKKISFAQLKKKLNPLGTVSSNEFMLNFEVDNQKLVVFPDGRAIVKNTSDESLARGLYAKYIGM
ncbi:MAG: thiazole biosynthesis adenylyltransferase ThiF [Chloroflexi bacterium]|jgi:molybdopterin-synthase adenylyltransferase|nr:thiazole biosynthesis adenylyltransferase ThiF [Chloroflexota bacterium]MBT7081533.1 thiazole biosynthesis adenylyltransferase ThiF [Chloroflexota bacterium]MBT7289354.1 thiazole biosynthesis adenylyltransferase ThiF [Chloroflexota bacterium]